MGALNEIIKKILAVVFVCTSFSVIIPLSYATSDTSSSLRNMEEFWSNIGMPVIKKRVNADGAFIGIYSQDGITTMSRIITEAIKYVGILAMIAINWAGVMYVTAYGEDKKVATAKHILIYSMFALILSISAYAIVDLINSFNIG